MNRLTWTLMGLFLFAIFGFLVVVCVWASSGVVADKVSWAPIIFIPMGVFCAVMCLDILGQLLTGRSAMRAVGRRLGQERKMQP